MLVHESGASVVLFEQTERVPPKDDLLWQEPSLRAVVAMKSGRRRPPDGWEQQLLHLQHETLSGVTRIRSTFTLFRRRGAPAPGKPQPTGVDATLSTVIIPTTRMWGSLTVSTPVNERPLSDLKQDARRQVTRPELDNGRFAVHSVFVPQGHVVRKLSDEEKLSALDMPGHLLKNASADTKRRWLNSLKTPYKSRVQVLQCLLPIIQEVSAAEPDIKRRKTTPEPAKAPSQERALSRHQELKLRNKLEEMLADLKLNRSSQVEELQPEPEEEIQPEEHPEEESGPKAVVKSDDAEVPVHLWNNRVAKRLQLDPKDPAFVRSCDRLRARLFRQWLWNVETSYFTWLRQMQ